MVSKVTVRAPSSTANLGPGFDTFGLAIDAFYDEITLTKTKEHNPMLSAISEIGDTQYTFCQDCENNIERYYYDGDPERLPEWTDWYVSK